VGTSKLQMFSLTEGFTLQLKAALIVGVIVSLPVIIRQVWAFVSPAIDRVHRAFLRNTIIAAVVLFYGGAAFTFFFFTPYTIRMLLTFMPENMELTINASSYLSFLFFFCAAMGLVFEMPLAIMILTRLGIVTPETLSRKRKYAIVVIWIIAAVITPTTDVLTLTLVAVPLMFLYEVSIIISKIMLFRKARRERA
ncbi:MAG TPA: twin-arginine translocase subunit TatC, partial [Spirochaetota bacterium]|nr:twin-arginine translocase subunit TatC [Spirochaetota bacterium]